jgi:hypothetical protein
LDSSACNCCSCGYCSCTCPRLPGNIYLFDGLREPVRQLLVEYQHSDVSEEEGKEEDEEDKESEEGEEVSEAVEVSEEDKEDKESEEDEEDEESEEEESEVSEFQYFGGVLVHYLDVDKTSRAYTGTKYIGTEEWNSYKIEPVAKGTLQVNQIVGRIAFSDITTYYISGKGEAPKKLPNTPNIVTVYQSLFFKDYVNKQKEVPVENIKPADSTLGVYPLNFVFRTPYWYANYFLKYMRKKPLLIWAPTKNCAVFAKWLGEKNFGDCLILTEYNPYRTRYVSEDKYGNLVKRFADTGEIDTGVDDHDIDTKVYFPYEITHMYLRDLRK